jgi:lysophospholipase L1-like esterase
MDIDMGPGELFPVADGGETAPCYVAIGDSFTEGLNDPAPGGGFRGWADRLAGMLAAEYPELRYANLAIRGRLLRQIVHDQVPAALDLLAGSGGPGLVSLAAGGNDILRPGADPDTLAELFDAGVSRLRESGCQVLIFTGFDPKAFPVMRLLRGRIAAYNMHLRAIADERGCYLTDLWSIRFLHEPRAWSSDRLHLASQAHQRVALRAAEVLGLPVTEDWREIPAAMPVTAAPAGAGGPLAVVPGAGPLAGAPAAASSVRAAWLAARREDAQWAKEYLVPWINRRLHGTSSGDGLLPKRPDLQPVTPAVTSGGPRGSGDR